MSLIHYFPRYNQKENQVTNNTQLLLSRLYYHSPLKFEKILNEILTDEIFNLNVGVNFSQQNKGHNSIPDGSISQESFQILIETKTSSGFSANQLIRHLSGFDKQYSDKILLALSPYDVPVEVITKVNRHIKSGDPKRIRFTATTFAQIIAAVRNNISEYETEISEVLNDFEEYCIESKLVNYHESSTLLAFSTSRSHKENKKYNLYYDPATRNNNHKFTYLGLYRNKKIYAIGKYSKTVYCDLYEGKLVPTRGETLDITDDEYQRIKDIIEETDYYDLRYGNKFTLVDEFIKTEFKKDSPYGMRQKQYFFLKNYTDKAAEMSTEEIAEFLKKKTW